MLGYTLLVSFVSILIIIGYRHFGIRKGKKFYDDDGLAEFIQNSRELHFYLKRLFKYLIKIIKQYTFHFLVRMLYYVKLMFDRAYSFARDRFLKTTIQDKKAVSRFWVHLKEYKQEIDEEKKK